MRSCPNFYREICQLRWNSFQSDFYRAFILCINYSTQCIIKKTVSVQLNNEVDWYFTRDMSSARIYRSIYIVTFSIDTTSYDRVIGRIVSDPHNAKNFVHSDLTYSISNQSSFQTRQRRSSHLIVMPEIVEQNTHPFPEYLSSLARVTTLSTNASSSTTSKISTQRDGTSAQIFTKERVTLTTWHMESIWITGNVFDKSTFDTWVKRNSSIRDTKCS